MDAFPKGLPRSSKPPQQGQRRPRALGDGEVQSNLDVCYQTRTQSCDRYGLGNKTQVFVCGNAIPAFYLSKKILLREKIYAGKACQGQTLAYYGNP